MRIPFRVSLSAMGFGLFASAAFPHHAHAIAVPRDGLVLYMAFEEGQGTALFDSASGMKTGTLMGAAVLTPQGKHGGGYFSTGVKGATDEVILELKFTGRFPRWYRELVQRFDCFQTGAAKYVESSFIHHGRGQGVHPRDMIRNMIL